MMMKNRLERFMDGLCRVGGMLLIGFGVWHGSIVGDFDRGSYNLVAGVFCLYVGGWRPESTVSVSVRTVIERAFSRKGDAA